MTRLVTTGNAVPVATAAIPVADTGSFRGEVLSGIAEGWRLLLLAGLSRDAAGTRLLAACSRTRRSPPGRGLTGGGLPAPAAAADAPGTSPAVMAAGPG